VASFRREENFSTGVIEKSMIPSFLTGKMRKCKIFGAKKYEMAKQPAKTKMQKSTLLRSSSMC
jgi:hypothetical protein